MELPKNEAVFDFEHTGEITEKKYDGRFTVLCLLSIGQKHLLELEKTRLLGNHANPTDGLNGIAEVLANLRIKIIDAPEWWKQSRGGSDILDEDVLVALYNKILEAGSQWRENLKQKAQKAQESATPSTP